jgi:hypothetical protein
MMRSIFELDNATKKNKKDMEKLVGKYNYFESQFEKLEGLRHIFL